MRSEEPFSPSLLTDWRGTWPVNRLARILWWRRICCASCPRRLRRRGIRNPERFAFTPSSAHVGTAALGCPAGRSPATLECWEERKSWRAALADSRGRLSLRVLAARSARNVTVEQRNKL